MKRFFCFIVLMTAWIGLFAQIGGNSQRCSFNIVKDVKPPLLSVEQSSIRFVDCSSNNAIDANETDYIKFTVANNGYGPAFNCVAKVKVEGSAKNIKIQNVNLPVIGLGKKIEVSIPLIAGLNTTDGTFTAIVTVEEPNGFGTDPFSLLIKTKSFAAPMLKVTDYIVTGSSGILQKKSQFNLRLLLKNVGGSSVESAVVSVVFPDGIFILEGDRNHLYKSIDPGSVQSIDYVLIASSNYNQNTIPIEVKIKEKYGKYSENRTIELTFDQVLATKQVENETANETVYEKVKVKVKVNTNASAPEIENETVLTTDEVYVDLGLSVKWATCNIGANSPEESGRYFAWGDVKGQTWNGTRWSGGGFSKYPKYELDSNGNLKPEYDAAHVLLGGTWRMPTKAEIEELINNCTTKWIKLNGVLGRKFTSRKNGKSIFLPAVGFVNFSCLFDSGSLGGYWSSSFSNDRYAGAIGFLSDNVSACSYDRGTGRSVRPVKK